MWCFLIIGSSITFYIIWLLFGIALISIFPSGSGTFSALIIVISLSLSLKCAHPPRGSYDQCIEGSSDSGGSNILKAERTFAPAAGASYVLDSSRFDQMLNLS